MHIIITFIAKYVIVIPIIVSVVWLVGAQPSRRSRYLVLLLVSGVIAGLLTKLGTVLIQDPRPFINGAVVPYFQSSTDNGFPSDHTVFITVFAATMWPFNRWLSICMYGIAVLVGASRVIAGVHHSWDILGGLLIGTIAVVFSYYTISLLRKESVSVKQ